MKRYDLCPTHDHDRPNPLTFLAQGLIQIHQCSNSRPTILRNESAPRQHWLEICLRGVRSNRDGVGARVRVAAGDLVQVAEVHAGRMAEPWARRRDAETHATLEKAGGRLVLHAARRWDRVSDRLAPAGGAAAEVARELDSPQLGARLALGRGLEARANWARASRAPEFVELFGDQASVTGNPQLVPESAENRDAGLAWRGRWRGHEGALEYARYRSDARDLVVFVRNSANTVRARNFGRALIRGEEWTARLELPGRLLLSAAWSWQSAINLGPLPEFYVGKRLPGRPTRQATARLEWRPGRPCGLRAAHGLRHLGATKPQNAPDPGSD